MGEEAGQGAVEETGGSYTASYDKNANSRFTLFVYEDSHCQVRLRFEPFVKTGNDSFDGLYYMYFAQDGTYRTNSSENDADFYEPR